MPWRGPSSNACECQRKRTMDTKQAIERIIELAGVARASDVEHPHRARLVRLQDMVRDESDGETTASEQIYNFMIALPDPQLRTIVTLVYWGRDNGQDDICVVHEQFSCQPREYAAQMVAWKTLRIAEYLETALRLAEEAGLDYEATLCPENVDR